MDKQKPKKKSHAYEPGLIVGAWFDLLPEEKLSRWTGLGYSRSELVDTAPRRFAIYEPMVLFPTGSYTDPAWAAVLAEASTEERARLWRAVLDAVSKTQSGELTHLAVNGSIPLHLPTTEGSLEAEARENLLRSPIQLTPLHGSFGPEQVDPNPSSQDFEEAFWVSTKQNGITQTWAPRWTMFSRGNITEKARLLNFHSSPTGSRRRSGSALRGKWAVDLYAGIGYFVFSYAKQGLRVLCWEMNPWSVEGLRRGGLRNGWSVKVVQGKELGKPLQEVVGEERVVVFLEDNAHALRRIKELRRTREVDILHVNGGLLPTSKDTWEDSLAMTRPGSEAWLHLHENVGEDDIPSRRQEIQDLFTRWTGSEGSQRAVVVEHVEKVKTFAPRVWHCVFDVYITKADVSLLA